MIKLKKFIGHGMFWSAVMMLPAVSHATLVNGSTLQAGGDAVVGATFLNWQCDQPGDTTACLSGYGDFSVGGAGPSTGSFAQYNGSFGQILGINAVNAPLNTPVSIPNWVFFNQPGNATTGNITLTLNLIPLGTDTTSTTCAGLTHCTPTNPALVDPTHNPLGLSAFNLDQNAGGTTASFAVNGTLHDGVGDVANFVAIFSATFAGQTPQSVLANFISTNGTSPVESYANSVTLNIVPEPASLLLTGVALIGVGCLRKQLFSKFGRR